VPDRPTHPDSLNWLGDQEIIRAGLSTILNGQVDIEVVGAAADGSEAVTLARELRPESTKPGGDRNVGL